jgi:hypothetical protein
MLEHESTHIFWWNKYKEMLSSGHPTLLTCPYWVYGVQYGACFWLLHKKMLIPHSSPLRPSFTTSMHLPWPTPPCCPPAAHLPIVGDARRGQRSRLHRGGPHLPALSPRAAQSLAEAAQPPDCWHPPHPRATPQHQPPRRRASIRLSNK